MAQRIAFFHEKGGVRKSSIAVPYAKHRETPYYTNDRHYMLAQRLLPAGTIHFLEGEMDIPEKAVFDLAGASDRELIKNLGAVLDTISCLGFSHEEKSSQQIQAGQTSRIVRSRSNSSYSGIISWC